MVRSVELVLSEALAMLHRRQLIEVVRAVHDDSVTFVVVGSGVDAVALDVTAVQYLPNQSGR